MDYFILISISIITMVFSAIVYIIFSLKKEAERFRSEALDYLFKEEENEED